MSKAFNIILDGFLEFAEATNNQNIKRMISDYEEEKNNDSEDLSEDTIKQGNKWVNKGKEGTHGKFKTKKEADAQRRAIWVNWNK